MNAQVAQRLKTGKKIPIISLLSSDFSQATREGEQQVEHVTVNHGVVGSSPTGGAFYFNTMLSEIILAFGMAAADSAPNNLVNHDYAQRPKIIALTFYRNSGGYLTVTNQCEMRYELKSSINLLDNVSKRKVSYDAGKEVEQVIFQKH